MGNAHATSLLEHGVEIIDDAIDHDVTAELARLCEPLLVEAGQRRPGVRQALKRQPLLGEALKQSRVNEIIEHAAGRDARVVRAIVFDKTPETNWAVPWHQDATIALADRIDTPGFGPWAVKDGEHHCQPPREILDSIAVVRISLDPCPPSAGPLLVVAKSHGRGLLDAASLAEVVARGPVVECATSRGGVVLMRPLSIHASRRSVDWPHRRRVLHLECSAANLPNGLRWAECHD